MPKKKINPMTQDQMLNVPYQFDMVPASEAVGPSGDAPDRDSSSSLMKVGRPAERSDVTEAQRVGRAMSKKYKADEDFGVYKEYDRKKGPQIYKASENEDEHPLWQFLNDRMNATTEDVRTAKSQAGYKKGGMVRGFGIAARGRGKGKMY